MFLQLGCLLGPRRAWRAAVALGTLAEPETEPVSSRRRLLVHQGLTGIAAAAAVLATEAVHPSVRALAEDVTSEGDVTDEGGGRRWDAVEVTGKAFDRLREQATDDRNFGVIRDYFAKDPDWEGKGRNAIRITRRGNNVRKTYAQHFKRKGQAKFVNVVFGVEDDGRDWVRGWAWGGGRVHNEYYVQNGNLRDDDGRVTTEAQSLPFDITECDVDHVLCSLLVAEGCLAGGAAVAVLCGSSAGAACLGVGGPLLVACDQGMDPAISACKSWASEGKCS